MKTKKRTAERIEADKVYNKQYYLENKERMVPMIIAASKKRYQSDPNYKWQMQERCKFKMVLRKILALKKLKEDQTAVGCSAEFLKQHLENQFKEGMTWDNYTVTWQIDHIIPFFSAKTEEDRLKVTNYMNLQPIFIEDHKIKTAQERSIK